jgi:FkbM family methyltransferase
MWDFDRLYGIALQPNVGDFFEEIIERIYRRHLKPGDVAIDAGANVGRHTLPLSEAVGPTGSIVAVEAVPVLCEALPAILWPEEGARAFDNVEIVGCALAGEAGRASFSFVAGSTGYSALRQRDLPDDLSASVERIEVPVETLDGLMARRPRPVAFLKADIEGGEYDMLRGAHALLLADRPTMVLECGRGQQAALYGYAMEDWFALLGGLGYIQFDIFGRPFGPAQWNEKAMPWYVMAVPSERAATEAVRAEMDRCIGEALIARLEARHEEESRPAPAEPEPAVESPPPPPPPARRRNGILGLFRRERG